MSRQSNDKPLLHRVSRFLFILFFFSKHSTNFCCSRVSPTNTTSFIFDDSLIQDTPGKLQPNQLTVDNLTIDWLRSRLTELDVKIKEEQEKMLELGESILNNGKSQDTMNK